MWRYDVIGKSHYLSRTCGEDDSLAWIQSGLRVAMGMSMDLIIYQSKKYHNWR
jgi:hypothetical protein